MRSCIDVRTAVPGAIYPPEFGNWHSIYMQFSRWTQNGVFARIYAALSEAGLQQVTAYALGATSVKVHPDAFGCLKKRQTSTREVARVLEYQDSRTGRKRYAPKRLYLIRWRRTGRTGRASCA